MDKRYFFKVLPFFLMLQKIECWKRVINDHSLLSKIQESTLSNVATMAKLRKQWTVDEITVAAELVAAREKAKGKLDNAITLASDSSGVQQATSSAIARHKAKRFMGHSNIVDLCCGIGSDLCALPDNAIGVDLDSLRCWMAEENTNKTVHCCDATTFELTDDCVIHVDPARRNSAGRIFELEEMIPKFSEVVTIAKKTSGGCIKLSPAVNPEDIKQLPPFEIEYIEEKNRLVQAALWYGSLTQKDGKTTATSIKLGESFSGIIEPTTFSKKINKWILEPNVALERASLHGTLGNEFNASELAPGIGLLTTNENPKSPWFTSFELLATTSLRLEKVVAVLRDLKCTQVEVKTRGKTVDPNQWQKKLNKKASGPLLTIFALRLGKKHVALIARRFVSQ